jgi:hypothetical protein
MKTFCFGDYIVKSPWFKPSTAKGVFKQEKYKILKRYTSFVGGSAFGSNCFILEMRVKTMEKLLISWSPSLNF